MATLTAPLHSLSASGQLGNAVIYETSRGRTYAKAYKVPANPRSAAQSLVRQTTKYLARTWPTLTTAEKATWENLARETNLSPFNAYTHVNHPRIISGIRDTRIYPPDQFYRLYSGGTITPILANISKTYQGTGTMVLRGNEIWATPNLKTFQAQSMSTLNGLFDFSYCNYLTTLRLDNTDSTTPPNLKHCPLLNFIVLSNVAYSVLPDFSTCPALAVVYCANLGLTAYPAIDALPLLNTFEWDAMPITATPDFTHNPLINDIELAGNSMVEVDSIFNWVAANRPHNSSGYLNVSGAGNAAVTAASAAARTALTAPNGNWTLIYHT